MTMPAGRLCANAALLAAAVVTGACQAGEPGELRLVHADPFSIVFMENAPLDRPKPDAPVEVQTWSFFDEPDRPGRGPGWNTRISRVRVDCQAGMLGTLHHTVLQDETHVQDVTPDYRMQAPNGLEKAAVMAWVCDPEDKPQETVVRDLAAAREWARAAWPGLNPDHPARRNQP